VLHSTVISTLYPSVRDYATLRCLRFVLMLALCAIMHSRVMLSDFFTLSTMSQTDDLYRRYMALVSRVGLYVVAVLGSWYRYCQV